MSDKIKIQLGSIAALVIVALSLLLSQNSTPDAPPLFGLKRVQENVFLKLKSNPDQKFEYMQTLLNRRLEELGSQVRRESYGYILPSASRYSTLAGQLTEMALVLKDKNKASSLKEQFANHQKALQQIYIVYPKNTENVEYKYIEDDINYLKIYSDKLTQIK